MPTDAIDRHGDGHADSRAQKECHLTSACERIAAEEGNDRDEQSDKHDDRNGGYERVGIIFHGVSGGVRVVGGFYSSRSRYQSM